MTLRHWRFNVFWNGAGGDGTSDGGDGTSGDSATGFGGSVSFGGSPQGQGGIGSDAVAGGTANATAPAGTTSTTGGTTGGVTGVSATGGFGHGGVGPAGPSGAAAGGAATGGGGGTASGGSASGPGFGPPATAQDVADHNTALQDLFNSQHSSAVTNPGTENLLGHAANMGVSALSSLARGSPSPSLTALAQALGSSNAFGPSQSAAAQANVNSTLAGLASALAGINATTSLLGINKGQGDPGAAGSSAVGSPDTFGATVADLAPSMMGVPPGAITGMNMGFPAVEGVSPGLTAAPAGPSPDAISLPGLGGGPAGQNTTGMPTGVGGSDVAGGMPTGLDFGNNVAPPAPPSDVIGPPPANPNTDLATVMQQVLGDNQNPTEDEVNNAYNVAKALIYAYQTYGPPRGDGFQYSPRSPTNPPVVPIPNANPPSVYNPGPNSMGI